jgi:hypothetical protein
MDKTPSLIFGIFPGITGTENEMYRAALETYDPTQTDRALAQLQLPGQPFLVRGYTIYKGGGRVESETPPDVSRYFHSGRQLDYVLCYRSSDGNLDDWKSFVRQTVRKHGSHLGALQITEEPNNPHAGTGGDGSSPNVRQAIIEGVVAAKDEAQRSGLTIAVGFNATPSFPNDDFWPDLGTRNSAAFLAALDYVGLDFFPDVFRRIPFEDLQRAVEGVLHGFREVSLAAGGIPATVPIRITENGWPTTPSRTLERQCEVLETVVRSIHQLRGALNITHYEFFALRDAKEGNPEELCQFGLLRMDYNAKPAFETYRRLIAELSTPEADG